MFDIGWQELLVVATVAILVVGPKELPGMLRTFGQLVAKLRRMAGEFQSTFNDALREAERQAELDDVKKSLNEVRSLDPLKDVKDQMNPLSAIEGATNPAKSYSSTGPAPRDPVDEAVAEMNPEYDEAATGEDNVPATDTTAAKPADTTPKQA